LTLADPCKAKLVVGPDFNGNNEKGRSNVRSSHTPSIQEGRIEVVVDGPCVIVAIFRLRLWRHVPNHSVRGHTENGERVFIFGSRALYFKQNPVGVGISDTELEELDVVDIGRQRAQEAWWEGGVGSASVAATLPPAFLRARFSAFGSFHIPSVVFVSLAVLTIVSALRGSRPRNKKAVTYAWSAW
jgi:hypothetical protein